MYEVDYDKFTSKPDPKKEFAHYFKESGAAASLQRAMGLLYRMPVKPTNLAEFFSQYFENGAQQLMRISLLKAEVCYKRDELQNIRSKVQEAESLIKEMVDKLGLTEEDFNKQYVPLRIKEKNRLSILERYFRDMESSIISRKTMEEHWVPTTSSYLVDPKIEISAPRDSNYDAENDCMKNVKSDSAIKEDIKELDPWGIICRVAKGEEKRHDLESNESHHHSHATEHEEHELDEDDGTSLAELFQQTSRDWVIQDHDEQTAQLHNRLLMVKKADRVQISEFMGWSPLQSRENLQLRVSGASSSRQEQEHFVSDNLQDYTDIERLKRRPCSQKRAELITSQGVINADTNPPEADNDAFLLDEDHLEHAYKLMETTQENFDYEFQRYTRAPRKSTIEGICEPVCELADLERICSASADSLRESLNYGEDGYEDDSLNESLGFIPGKMSNWTNLYTDHPSMCSAGEYYDEFRGEIGHSKSCAQASALVSTINSKTPLEVPMARIDSSCHCMFTGIYGVSEMLTESKGTDTETNNDKEKEGENNNSNRKSSSRKGRLSIQKDEATITEDSALENELHQVFKQNQNRKSVAKKEKEKNEDATVDPEHNIDVFGIDLAKEVKRTILGFTPSELNNDTHHNATPAPQSKFYNSLTKQ